MAKSTKTETPKPEGALVAPATGGAMALPFDYGTDANLGFENTTARDFTVPFLNVLQSNSPAVAESKIPNAKAGMFVDSVSSELYPGAEGVFLIPCDTQHCYTEFVPRAKGGGFVGTHTLQSDVVKAAVARNNGKTFGKLATAEGNELIETFYLYYIRLANADATEASGFGVFAFTSTKIKAYQSYMTRLRTLKQRPPIFSHRLKITTWPDKNAHGSFFNVKAEAAIENNVLKSMIDPGSALYAEAKQFMEAVRAGLAKAAFETQRTDSGGDPAGDEAFG